MKAGIVLTRINESQLHVRLNGKHLGFIQRMFVREELQWEALYGDAPHQKVIGRKIGRDAKDWVINRLVDYHQAHCFVASCVNAPERDWRLETQVR